MRDHYKIIGILFVLILLFIGYFFWCSFVPTSERYFWLFTCKERVSTSMHRAQNHTENTRDENAQQFTKQMLNALKHDAAFLDTLRGMPGKDGRDGATGPRGQRGADGRDGQDGADGSAGQDGRDGTNTFDATHHLAFDNATGVLTHGDDHVDITSFVQSHDQDTHYSAGTGINLSATNVFSAEDAIVGNEVVDVTTDSGLERSGAGTTADPYTVGLTSACSDGEVLSWSAGSTSWVCTTPASPAPFITSNMQSLGTSSTATVTIKGYNFIPTTAVAIPGFGGTIDNVNIISPVEMALTLTTDTTTGLYDIVLSNDGILNTIWSGNGEDLLRVSNNDGTGATSPGESCKDILDNGYSTGDGMYWIDPNGAPTTDSFEVYCDMTTDGGGWTRIEYATDLPHQAQFSGGDSDRWLPTDFTLTLSDTQINDLRNVSTEGKQRYHGTCQGVIHYKYQTANYAYAFGFRFHNGDETAFDQQTYPSTTITVPYDGCQINNNTMESTDFDIVDIRVPIINVHSRDNSSTEKFGSPLTNYPAWLR